MTYAMILLGGLLYRQRGGGIDLPIGTQGARMVWCIPTGALVGWLSGSPIVGAAVAAMAFVGLLIPHGRYQDNGTYGGTPLGDALGMSCVCAVRGLLTAIPPLWCPELDPVPLSAMVVLPALSGVAYWLGWRIPSTTPHLERGCALGEFFTGCLFWAGILLAFA